MENTSHTLKKNHFDGNFVKFSRQFLVKFTKNRTETSNNFIGKLQRNAEEILEMFGALLEIYLRALQV